MGLSAKQTKLKTAANSDYQKSLGFQKDADSSLSNALVGAFSFGLTFVEDRAELYDLIKDMGQKPSREDTTWWTDVVKACFATDASERKNAFEFPTSAAISKFQTILAYAHYLQWDQDAFRSELEARSAHEIYKDAQADIEFSTTYLQRAKRSIADAAAIKRLNAACGHTFDEDLITLSHDDLSHLLDTSDDGFGSILFRRDSGKIKLWRAPVDEAFVRKTIDQYAKVQNPRKPLTDALHMRSLLPKALGRHINFQHEGEQTHVCLFGTKVGSAAIRFTVNKVDVPDNSTFDEKGINQLLGLAKGVGDDRFVWEPVSNGVRVTAADQQALPDTESVYNYLHEEGNQWSSPDGTDRVDFWLVEAIEEAIEPNALSTKAILPLSEESAAKLAAESSWSGSITTLQISDGNLRIQCAKKWTSIFFEDAQNLETIKLLKGEFGRLAGKLEGDRKLGVDKRGVQLMGEIKGKQVSISVPSVE